MPTLPLFKMDMAVVLPKLPTLKIKFWFVAVLPAALLLPSKVIVPLAEVLPIIKGSVMDVVNVGVAIVGEVLKTKLPAEPVLSEMIVPRFALLGVARNVATLEPRPLTPEEIGRPVALARLPEEGVPKAPPETKFPEAVPVRAPTKVVAESAPVDGTKVSLVEDVF